MAREIEKKFLLDGHGWRGLAPGVPYRQGYLTSGSGATVRVRIAGSRGFLTVKGPDEEGVKLEYEYEIPEVDAQEMLSRLCRGPLIEKIRYRIPFGGFTWEVDEFLGENAGLLLAEIELDAVDQDFVKPAWIGREVTGDSRYYNASLVHHPYCRWRE